MQEKYKNIIICLKLITNFQFVNFVSKIFSKLNLHYYRTLLATHSQCLLVCSNPVFSNFRGVPRQGILLLIMQHRRKHLIIEINILWQFKFKQNLLEFTLALTNFNLIVGTNLWRAPLPVGGVIALLVSEFMRRGYII